MRSITRARALEYALQFAGDMDAALAREVRRTLRQPLHGGWRGADPRAAQSSWIWLEAGLIANKVEVEFIR